MNKIFHCENEKLIFSKIKNTLTVRGNKREEKMKLKLYMCEKEKCHREA